MALDAQDRTNITLLRYGMDSPKVADLIVDMDKQYGDMPAMKQVNATFSDLATGNSGQLKKLNEMLEKNPGLAEKIKANLGKNPEAFRTQFLPAVFKNPENAVALAEQAPVAKPVAPAPFQRSYGDYPEPGPIRAAAAGVAATVAGGAAAAPAPAQAANAPSNGKALSADERLKAKMDILSKADGFNDLMDRVEKNPELGAAMKAVMASNRSPAEREQSVDLLLKKTKENPKFFKNIVEQIDTFPGAVSGIASQIAGDPKNALSKLSELGDGGGMGGLGIFAKMFSGGGMNGMGGILNMIMGLLKSVMGMFGGSANHLIVGGNSKMEQYEKAIEASPQKNPDRKVAALTDSGEVISGAQATAQNTDQTRTAPARIQSQPA